MTKRAIRGIKTLSREASLRIRISDIEECIGNRKRGGSTRKRAPKGDARAALGNRRGFVEFSEPCGESTGHHRHQAATPRRGTKSEVSKKRMRTP